MSSKMAIAVNRIFKESGTREPNNETIPKVNAISVAVGIAQPCK